MKLGPKLRDAFPRDWWRSGRWWAELAGGILMNGAVAVFTALFIVRLTRLIRLRDNPYAVYRLARPVQGYGIGLALNGVGVWGVALISLSSTTTRPLFEIWATAIALSWYVVSSLLCAIAVGLTLRSRLRWRSAWVDLDFVEAYVVKHRPPETVEEYRALRLQQEHARR